MKVVILGAGRRGIRLARHLVEEKKDVVMIDQRASEINRAMTSVDCLGVVASGTDAEELRNAGVSNADAFIALSGSDEINLVSCGIVSAEFGVPLTIAAVRSLSYTEKAKSVNLLGISHIVNPSQEAARHIFGDIDKGLYSDIISFENSSLVLYNIYIDSKSKFRNKAVRELRQLIPGQFIIAAVSSNGNVFVPNGDTVIHENDTLSITISEDTAEEMLEEMGRVRPKAEKIVIIGATMVTDFLLRLLSRKRRRHTTVIARDPQACEELALKYPDVLVLNENITNEGVFRQENLDSYDLMISATDSDELNIIIASYGKHYGIKSTMALVNKNHDFIRMADHLGIDSLLSTQDVTVDSIVKYLQGINISGIHSLFEGKIEALEYKIPSNCPLCGKPLKDINMKGKGIIVGARKPDGTSLLPGGDYTVNEGDSLIMVIDRQELDFIQQLLGIKAF